MFEKHTTVETRLEQFRELRKSNLSMNAVVERFGVIKPCNRYLDYWTPESWPKPFDLIEQGHFDTTAISILMYQTLGHLNYLKPELVSWEVISNNMNGKDGAVFTYKRMMYNLDPIKAIESHVATDHYTTLTELKNLHIPLV